MAEETKQVLEQQFEVRLRDCRMVERQKLDQKVAELEDRLGKQRSEFAEKLSTFEAERGTSVDAATAKAREEMEKEKAAKIEEVRAELVRERDAQLEKLTLKLGIARGARMTFSAREIRTPLRE